MNTKPYNPLSDYLKDRYGERIHKVAVDLDLTCPNKDGTKGIGGCLYCDSSTLVPIGLKPSMTVTEQIETGIARAKTRRRANKFIAYFQINTNTYAPLDILERSYREAARHPDIVCLAVSTRPDCLEENVLALLARIKEEKDIWLEVGLQTSNDETLKLIKRGHTSSDFSDALKRARDKGIDVCAHVILWLPGEGREEAVETMRFLAHHNIWGVKFHQLDIVRGTPLEEMHKRGGVKTLSLDEYSSLVVECLEELPPSTVIHRLSGETPASRLVAPVWDGGRFAVIERVLKLMEERKTRQGARFKSPAPKRL